MDRYQQTFRPHQFEPGKDYIDLYHAYDDSSRTPYKHGIGIECEDPDEYLMNAWHVITPPAMRCHPDWTNCSRTQFISFYDNLSHAQREAQRRIAQRYVPNVGQRQARSVRIAHVRLPWGSNLWAFSRAEMLNMMGLLSPQTRLDMMRISGASEWFVWGAIPEDHVQNRHLL